MDLATMSSRWSNVSSALTDMSHSGHVKVMMGLFGPAVRGFLMRRGRQPSGRSEVATRVTSHFDWRYVRDRQELARLYTQAKKSQWDPDTSLPWHLEVDPQRRDRPLMVDDMVPIAGLPAFGRLTEREKNDQRSAILAWLLSQFLHGEQGALFAACQVTQAVGWMDGKLYGATQVVDEGRHVEVFHRYLDQKLGRVYEINDNLYVVIDSLMGDGRWDIKFLGMQILIEGLALGAFGTLRQATAEPLLADLLRLVMLDEARHVAFGVLALEHLYTRELTESERREREDWAYEMSVLLRNRFLAREFYDEYWAHAVSRETWDKTILESTFLGTFRRRMFRRIIPNLKRIGLLSDRIRPYYANIGLLEHEHELAAPDLRGESWVEG